MAEEYKDQAVSGQEEGVGEVKDRGLFDYFKGKKEEAHEEKPQHEEDHQQESLVTGVENIHIDEGHKEEEKKEKEEKEKEKHEIFDKLRRSHSSSSSSSSDEEEEVEGEGGVKEKIKKKKGLKEKIDEKFHGGEKKEEEPVNVPPSAEDTSVVVEKVDVHETSEPSEEEKKHGFLERIKEKLPGHGKKPSEEGGIVPPAPSPAVPAGIDGGALEHGKEQEVDGHDGKEKKGFLGKIIEKLPGYHKNTGEDVDKSPASH